MTKLLKTIFLPLFSLLATLPGCSSTGTGQLDTSPKLDGSVVPTTLDAADAQSTTADTQSTTKSDTGRDRDTGLTTSADTGRARDALAADTRPVVSPGACTASDDIQLIGNQILDMSGTRFVARGPEIVVASSNLTAAIDAIDATGANAARFLLTLDAANGMTPEKFDTLLARAVSKNLILWISLYTWNGDKGNPIAAELGGGNFYSLTAPTGAGNCSSKTPTACYLAVWSRDWLRNLTTKYKGHIIVDAMQEYIGVANVESEAGRTEWADAAKANIRWFRSAGFTNPLEVMTNFQGRDLYAIVEKGESIRSVDSRTISGYPQTMFGWQAYWSGESYKTTQGSLLLGKSNGRLTAAEAIHQFVVTQAFPIQVGFDAYNPDTGAEYVDQINQSATDQSHWLWWSWNDGSQDVACTSHPECSATVIKSANGFAGAVKSTCSL